MPCVALHNSCGGHTAAVVQLYVYALCVCVCVLCGGVVSDYECGRWYVAYCVVVRALPVRTRCNPDHQRA